MHRKDFVSLRDFQPGEIRHFLDVACMVKANPLPSTATLMRFGAVVLFANPIWMSKAAGWLLAVLLAGFPMRMTCKGSAPTALAPVQLPLLRGFRLSSPMMVADSTPAHRQTLLNVQPIDSLHVHRLSATLQYCMQSPISIARLLSGQLHQLVA